VNLIYTGFNILSAKAVRRFVILIPVILFGTLLETLSVGMILPALGILLNGSFFQEYDIIRTIFPFTEKLLHEKLIIFGLTALGLVFIIKNLYLFIQIRFQGTFVYSAKREITLQLLNKYLSKSYIHHLSVNSSLMLRNLTTEINSYCNFFLMPVVNIITESLVIIFLLLLIILVEPVGSLLLVISLSLILLLFVKCTHRLVGEWGQQRLNAEEKKIKHIQECLGAVKPIFLSRNKEYFLKSFNLPNHVSGLMDKREYIFQYVPKLGVETIAVCALIMMCLYLLWNGKTYLEITYMLGLMASAGFRLIPSFSRILNNYQCLRYGSASVKVLFDEFGDSSTESSNQIEELKDNKPQCLLFKERITFSNVSFSYDKKSKLLDKINLSVSKGSTIGLTGSSGSGKSTFTDLMLGLIELDLGKIEIDGQPLKKRDRSNWFSMIGYVPQDLYILDDTISRNIAFGLEDEKIDNDRIWEVLNIVNLKFFVEQSQNGVDTLLGEHGAKLSVGQKQRLGVARALYHDPEILILDEFTSALDRDNEQQILKTFLPLKGKKTILMITHSSYPLSICDQIYSLEDGKIKLMENDSTPVHAGK